jgi:hypothetical protein
MKAWYKTLVLWLLTLHLTSDVWSQSTFQNLGFESASFVPIPGDLYKRVEFAAAFPGWSCRYQGGIQENAALSNCPIIFAWALQGL